ncbi:SEC-C metal-binding domain-containing protein [Pullulanibacillus sp. KACC 23026]|uniref:tetratricopeptide repeat protein n=1 Tax=Pullulanibacillus sp. KACC 23026 TaxID=3028315 RepID=UPI0023B1734B|nr:tetratricopeptide repeat protein [Pullulanibacillus sp. KACC 23026]WEG13446.1 SEC-C metal-binding domain-containing protein [Pullulanibacillus sp. KACC 23026]
MPKIRRNDPCSCGSGKKYKNCCGNNQVVSLERILHQEIMDLQVELMDFALKNYEEDIFLSIKETEIPFQKLETELGQDLHVFLYMILANWIVLEVAVEEEQRIIDLFIQRKLRQIKRERLKAILLSWREGFSFVGRLVSKEPSDLFLLKNIMDQQEVRVQVLEPERYKNTELNSLIMGNLLPMSGQAFTFFAAFMDVHPEESDEVEGRIRGIYDEHLNSYEDDSHSFFSDHFPEILASVFFDREKMRSLASYEWENPVHGLVAALYYEKILEEEYVPANLIQFGLELWQTFCLRKHPTIRNPKLFAAALHYLVSCLLPFNQPTQKQIAQAYEVSASSLSTKYRELESVLKQDIDEFFAHEEEDESLPELELESPPDSMSKEEWAKELLDQAYQATGRTQIKLARQALNLDPNNPDVYQLLGDLTPNYKEKLTLFKTGMTVGEKLLGKKFFEQNKGYFWGLWETRPYMRVKLSYADTLLECGEYIEAIAQYKELLELNEMDNQGVRFPLFKAYVEIRRLDEAEQLLDKYPEKNATALYNRCLVEGLRNGKGTKYKELLAQAEQQNPYVMRYLNKEIDMPQEIPESYRPGEPSEAILYTYLFGQLWWESRL